MPVCKVSLEFQLIQGLDCQLCGVVEVVVRLGVPECGIVQGCEHAVHDVVVVGERSEADAGAVGIMSRIAGECMHGHEGECSVHVSESRVEVRRAVVACVVAESHPLRHVKVELRTEVYLVELVGISAEYTFFIIIAGRYEVSDVLRSAAEGYVVLLDRMVVLEEFMVPVRVRIVYICIASFPLVYHYPRPVRMFGNIVSAGPELLHVGFSIESVVPSVCGREEEVVEVYGVIASGLEFSGSGRLCPSEASAVTHCGHAFLCLSRLCGHEYHTE